MKAASTSLMDEIGEGLGEMADLDELSHRCRRGGAAGGAFTPDEQAAETGRVREDFPERP
ncbi:hypothetical protein [Streptosporangium vulgare]|uniref:Uncharacterized protein n=1 Tax=Streptosporangium vulgare TaxID=46190 RepID=A0ABV5TSM0_9ACTN